ncbi:Hypothetical protein NF53_p2057 (plasmid) [Bacillus thuringiensis serovar indiana]|nr:Hypothetical protein NF53_p2057 [Bacillus thuringiensis serovar indiana]
MIANSVNKVTIIAAAIVIVFPIQLNTELIIIMLTSNKIILDVFVIFIHERVCVII